MTAAHAHAMDMGQHASPRLPVAGAGQRQKQGAGGAGPSGAASGGGGECLARLPVPQGRRSLRPPDDDDDEIDTVFGPKVRRDVEETRSLLNAGRRRGAMTGRCKMVGKTVETEEIEASCAVALAGLGDLPDTVASRAVIIRMRRRAPGEQVEPFRRRNHVPQRAGTRRLFDPWNDAVEPRRRAVRIDRLHSSDAPAERRAAGVVLFAGKRGGSRAGEADGAALLHRAPLRRQALVTDCRSSTKLVMCRQRDGNINCEVMIHR